MTFSLLPSTTSCNKSSAKSALLHLCSASCNFPFTCSFVPLQLSLQIRKISKICRSVFPGWSIRICSCLDVGTLNNVASCVYSAPIILASSYRPSSERRPERRTGGFNIDATDIFGQNKTMADPRSPRGRGASTSKGAPTYYSAKFS